MTLFFEKEFENSVSSIYKNAVLIASEAACKNCIDIFLIGGIVRDLILGNPIKDIDIAVQCDAVEFAKILEKDFSCEILNIQENLRTAKVKFQSGGVIDFASTRQEKYVESGVLPVAYNFGCDLKDDVKRRDFTINTLALRLTGKEKFSLVDYCCGYDDILKKKIKILHRKSFIDDPSRIIRALKFMVRFSFDLEDETSLLMQEYLSNINLNMPLERVKGELKQYFSINNKSLYEYIISSNAYKLISDNPISELNSERISTMNIEKSEVWLLYFVLLVVNSDYAIERLNLTGYEKKIIKEVDELLSKKFDISDKYEIYKAFTGLLDLSISIYYVITGNIAVHKFMKELKNIKVLTTGKDLIELGLHPSPYFNKIFEMILKKKLNDELISKSEELEFVKKNIKNGIENNL